MTPTRAGILWTAIGAIASGCADPVSPTPVSLSAVSGDAQVTLPGGQVPRPLVVQARDRAGNPRADVLVRWIASQGSSFAIDTVRTDATGLARATWTVGTTQALYTATAKTDSARSVSFSVTTADGAVALSPVPDTVRFHALDDTASIRIRVRSQGSNLDTVIDARGVGWPQNAVAIPVYAGKPGIVLQSVMNGTTHMNVNFGTIAIPFVAIVKQVPADMRITRLGTTAPTPDTLVIVPDSSLLLGVVTVDSRGRVIQDSSAMSNVAWSGSNTDVATVEPTSSSGVVRLRGVNDGVATITALASGKELRAHIRVWTLRVSAIATGAGTTCALVQDGKLACWGFREIGNNSQLNQALAPEVRNVGAFSVLRVSEYAACALTNTGAAYCWGRNESGSVGTGATSTYVADPVPVTGGLTFVDIGVGGTKACGLTAAGRVYCWGNGYDGALGDGTYGATPCGNGFTCNLIPKEVVGGRTYTQLAVADGGHACALTEDGRAFCWGTNRYSQLGSLRIRCAGWVGGDANTSNNWCSAVPVEVDGNLRFKQLSLGVSHSCGVTTDDRLYCWGMNLSGVLGTLAVSEGVSGIATAPTPVAPDIRFESVVAGRSHTCAIDSSDAAWCWGSGFIGQLGVGAPPTTQCTNGVCAREPVRVAGGLTFASLALKGSHTCGLTTTGLMYCWGWGGSGALGTGATTDQKTPARVVFQRTP
jgi:alpha-tubulin suppressor-like RCC1 family protein